MRGAALVLGLAGGLAAGLGLGWCLWATSDALEVEGPPTARAHASAAPQEALAATGRAGPVLDAAAPPSPPGASSATTSAQPPAVSAAATPLLDADPKFVEQRIAELAASIRARAQAEIASADASARAWAERQLTEERARRTDLARGGTMEFLRKNAARDSHWELLSSPNLFGRLFERRASGARVDGDRRRPEDPLAEGDRLVFPAGRFRLDTRVWRGKPFPADVVIEGAHMDQTLIVLDDELQMAGDVHTLTFRDLTIHCGDNYLESMRGGAYTLRLERCRVVGFDMGAGGSDMLSGSVGALYATGCRIEACFGRAPGFGNLFDVRGGLLVRMEDCDVVGPFRSVWQSGSASHVFERCRFREMEPRLQAEFDAPPHNVRFVDCTWEPRSEARGAQPKARDVAEINPAWALPTR